MNPVPVRIAEPRDGQIIRRLVRADAWAGLEHLDWSTVGANWLVAELEMEVVGCIAVLPMLPIGHVEHMGVAERLSMFNRARVVKALLYSAWSTLRLAGCGASMGTVPTSLREYVHALENRGGVVVDRSEVMIKRLG